jgi:hypothetical protein
MATATTVGATAITVGESETTVGATATTVGATVITVGATSIAVGITATIALDNMGIEQMGRETGMTTAQLTEETALMEGVLVGGKTTALAKMAATRTAITRGCTATTSVACREE